MAVTATAVFQGQHTFIFTVAAAADGDTGEVLINHGLNVPASYPVGTGTVSVPMRVAITPLFTGAAAVQAYYAVTTLNATQIGISKGAAGGGSANGGAAGCRVTVQMPHSITL